MEIIWFDDEEKYIRDFLTLPKKLYGKRDLMQNKSEEHKLLTGKHVLNKYFKLYKMCAYKNGEIAGRLALTKYPDDSIAYIGFFECIDDIKCASEMFAAADKLAKDNGMPKMVGPVDASFWIKYRLKVNLFERPPYTSEPYNKDYYLKLFIESGFAIEESYVSNIYRKLPKKGFEVTKFKERYKEFSEKGYEIISPNKKTWDKAIGEVYKLIMKLYSNFPIFKHLSEDDFKEIYSSYKMILDMSMVKIAYYEGEAVGFFISMPNYGNRLYGKINLPTLLYILAKRRKCSDYVLLYMGVDNKHKGLGKAMTQVIMDNLQIKQASSIGALIKKGKIVEQYVEEAREDQYEYVLLSKV
ncbi:hypothetical protein [Pseudobacteroides cellulosolvens]|uniref:N-acetyltransferase domain-containing protein n=1 Tax=Pseudobacteroides cellulosolvens ATCC 35603 = DSM 2933 TaxID=398512 RepID=A0A0L6JQ12_9FIRM|nr:hypothetical protein [Pseudobacteroides cellulosolvens]KNY27873.1 hypothetical protein Bccel_3144 [Pseudobacteroides cellulosolvens ATCC 35603 = DSM 2933]